jgi:TatD DNase family protein
MVSYIDTHCHLDLLPDSARALDGAPNTIVVAVTELPSRFRLLSTQLSREKRVRVALGLHPLRAATAGALEEGLLVRQLDRTDYVGEVGLDFSKQGRETQRVQLRVFERLLAESALRRKVVSIHSRGADRVAIERLRHARVRAILHWYTGPPGLVDDALSAGMYFSVNPSMLRSEKGRAVIAALPINRVLTESDGPFARTNGASSAPRDIASVVATLGIKWDMTADEARQVVHDNFASLLAVTVASMDLVESDGHEIDVPALPQSRWPEGPTEHPS